MEREIFNELWDKIVEGEIGKVTERCHKMDILKNKSVFFKDGIYNKYQKERKKLRKITKIDNKDFKLDRHKVAALFYFAFVDKIGEKTLNSTGFFVARKTAFNKVVAFNKASNVRNIFIIHETAFKIARGILESFIVSKTESDEGYGDENYKRHIEKKGITEPDLICFEKNEKTSYKDETLKWLIYAQNEKKLSVPILANIFFSLENDTRHCYEKQKITKKGRKLVGG
ncbi:MAG: hypothetical protein LBC87_01905 [Fibromonadaceae bacterium]|jgi:hypothetical protein|nr:hypothetical protein [Fibromonadaceae bacterium]